MKLCLNVHASKFEKGIWNNGKMSPKQVNMKNNEIVSTILVINNQMQNFKTEPKSKEKCSNTYSEQDL